MSKNASVKKPRRRLKRSVRRSLAAVLMITAIGVAAVPVPENYADNVTGDIQTYDDETSARAYSYPMVTEKIEKDSVDAEGNPIKIQVDYNKIDSAYEQYFDSASITTPKKNEQTYKTHYIFSTNPNSDNGGTSYRMEWQYEYFIRTVNKENKGIICGYNDTYPTDRLIVSTEPIHDYVVVSQDAFDEFKEKHANDAFYLNKEPSEADEGDQEFRIYFPGLYDQQVTAYKKYKEDLAKYTTDFNKYADAHAGEGLTDEQIEAAIGLTKPVEPNPKGITKYAGDQFNDDGSLKDTGFSSEKDDEAWRLYYCNKTSQLPGYILERVADSEATTAAGGEITVFSYVPRRIDISTKGTNDDDLGFRVQDTTSFLGISDRAFEGVQNVSNIELPDALKYIGDHAFEDSFIVSITMQNLTNIGNYAFKNCPRLAEVNLVMGVQNIGTEAFYGVSNLHEIVFPREIMYVGPGAFANCTLLSTVDFSKAALVVAIDDYAFYNDGALSKVDFKMAGTDGTDVRINTIGKAAFAVWNSASGTLTDFTFPSWISGNRKEAASGIGTGEGIGDYILAGRTNLQHVTMPSSYGMSEDTLIPNHIFQDCIGLEWVNFPDTGSSCGFARFENDLFSSVSNPDFYVQGPPYTMPSNRTPAYPRTSTWDAYSALAGTKDLKKVPNIPYVYFLNGKKYIEVSDGDYLECIDENGVLISCMLNPNLTNGKNPGSVDLVIPATVAGTTVTGIASDCFANDANETDRRKLSVVVRTLTLQDDSRIATIENSVFENWGNLERVYVGNSVRNIGNNAFQNCVSLIDVYFNTPESAAADFKVGTNAFQTNSSELTFHGMINTAYQPFTWAMDSGNTIDDTGRGIRVCYKSLAPTNLTVMRDNGTNQVTLLDYPKYDQIETILGETYAVKNGVYMSSTFDKAAYYREFMETTYESLYSSTQYNGKREQFRTAWENAGSSADIEALYKNFDIYGPWISRAFCNSLIAGRNGGKNTADAESSAFDWLFEPIVAYAATGRPDAYFETYPYDVYKNYTNTEEIFGPYQTYTEEEWALLNATRNITVPDGVTSIDVNGYMRSGANNGNVANYLSRDKIGTPTYGMYYTSQKDAAEINRKEDIQGGLFSGLYTDYDGTSGNETIAKGNDRLESIDLNQVTYLPDYAFDSCENLRSVTIGSACTNIKRLPFRGCTSLTTLNIAEDNPKYLAENRIMYSKDGENYTIEECLETRGKNNDNSLVSSALDTLIPSVTEISSEAFEACNFLSTVNLTDATKLSVIPENCFKNCESLIEVDLPIAVNKIDKGAFVGDNLTRLRIPGREVFISTEAFKHDDAKQQPTYVITYNDSSAKRYADTYGDKSQYYLVWEDIGELWDVKFYDMDGTLISETQVGDGEYLKRNQIPEQPVHEGYRFDSWVGTNGVDIYNDEITQNTDVIAKFNSLNGTVDGNYIVNFYDGVTGEQLGPTQLIPEGEDAVEPAYKFHEGYTFLKFSEESTNVTKNMSIIALYSVDAGAGNGVGSNTSGSTTNNGNNGGTTTSNRTTSLAVTATSSTSTTSSSGAATLHRVTVVGGSGSGSYPEGATVVIVADDQANFKEWRTESEGVNLVMMRASATTFTMPGNDVLIIAETNAPAPASTLTPAGTGTVSTNTNNTPVGTPENNGNTRVDITKPGISNKDLATANVNGSTDNFIVKISETPEATQAVINALTNKYGNLDDILYYAMDISLYDSTGTTKITDTTGLTVDITIPLPDALVTYGGNNMMGAVVSDQLEDMSVRFTTISGIPCISFTATHFSPYTIYVNTQNLSEGLLDVTPKTGDPIHPKWFLSLGLACLSIILFMKKDKKVKVKTA